MNGELVKDAAQGVVEDVPQDVAQDFGFRARAARNTRAPHFTPQHWLLCHMGLY